MNAWAACVGGALEERDYLDKVRRAGFVDAGLDVSLVYDVAALCAGVTLPEGVRLVSGFVHGRKP